MNLSRAAALAALPLAAAIGLSVANPSYAGDTSTTGKTAAVYHDDHLYTNAEVDQLAADHKAGKASKTGAAAKTAAASYSCYDYLLRQQASISGSPWTQSNMGIVRLYSNYCYPEEFKARTEHINGYVGWRTFTKVSICKAETTFLACVTPWNNDEGQFSSYAGDVIYNNVPPGSCARAEGYMQANKTDGKINGAAVAQCR